MLKSVFIHMFGYLVIFVVSYILPALPKPGVF